jgi:hypothetical protein
MLQLEPINGQSYDIVLKVVLHQYDGPFLHFNVFRMQEAFMNDINQHVHLPQSIIPDIVFVKQL